MKLSKGKKNCPLKVVVYGPEGIGKSTFASRFPDPLFIDTEGSTKHMDVLRVDPAPITWVELMDTVRQLATPQYRDGYGTLVLDTADWAEQMCARHLCAKANVDGIEGFGYGKGYTYLMEEFGKLLNLLEDVVNAGHNVVVTAHAALRKVEQPDEIGNYDRWEMKLQKKTAPMVKEWADMVLFANYKTIVVNVDNQGAAKGKNKAQGGARVMYTTHHVAWDAKNRFGLPDELPFDYGQIAHIIPDRTALDKLDAPAVMPEAPAPQAQVSQTPVTQAPVQAEPPAPTPMVNDQPQHPAPREASEPVPEALRRLMDASGISAAEIRHIVAKVGYFPEDTPIENYGMEFIMGMLVGDWNTVREMILAERGTTEDVPF